MVKELLKKSKLILLIENDEWSLEFRLGCVLEIINILRNDFPVASETVSIVFLFE